MNGKTHAYLDLAALPLVGTTLLDHRPAWVFRDDGAAVLWANASGVKFFGEESMGALLERPIGKSNPLLGQIKRLAKTVPTANPRMEILRVAHGFNITALPSACQRIELRDGTGAVLAVAAADEPSEPITSRAEDLADIIAGPDCLVAIIGSDGEILGASGEFQNFSPASATIDALAKSIERGDERIVKEEIQIAGLAHPSGISRFETDAGDPYSLLIVGPAEERMEAAESASSNSDAANAPVSEDITAASARPAVSSSVVPPAIRFLWRTDENHRLTFVSPELGDIVGAKNAGIVGNSWADVEADLLVGHETSLQAALDDRRQWSGIKVYWPLDDSGLRIAAELSGFPVTELGNFSGFRGFGVLRPDDSHYQGQQLDGSTSPVATAEKAASPETATRDAGPTETTPLPESSAKPEGLEKVDDNAHKSIGQDLKIVAGRDTWPDETPIPDKTAPTARPTEQSNVVPLTGNQPLTSPPEHGEHSGGEHDAFRRLVETLGAQKAQEKEPAEANAPEQTGVVPDGPPTGATKQLDLPAEPDTRIFDYLPIGIVVFRGDDTLFANRALLDLLGYDSPADFAAAGGHNAFFSDGDTDWTNSPSDQTEGLLSVRGKDGRCRQLEARLQTVTWANVKALMFSFREQTQRQGPGSVPNELVEEIAAAEARLGEFEAILDTATDGVVVIDDRGRICNLNRSAEALFGVEASEVLGTLFTGLLAEESRKAALDYLDGLASNGVASVLNDGREVIGKVPKGGLIPLFMTMGRVGKTDKFCAVLRDITHWKNAEEELVAARRAAEAANAQKSEFLAKISHEIRTPLNAIIGFSEVMMEERFGAIGNARYRDYLRDIHISGSHLMSLINDLLDLSKIEAGKLELTFESVAVNETIQECVALMQPQANRERIIIRTSLSSEVPNIVMDPRSLRQILLNLLSNAIKFTGAGGQVIVSTGSEDRGEVVIRIRDTGIGMSEKDIETALKPFRQLATSGQAQGEGTGLGLPLTKALVEANRAFFTIDSTVNQGTLVKITIPTTRVLAG